MKGLIKSGPIGEGRTYQGTKMCVHGRKFLNPGGVQGKGPLCRTKKKQNKVKVG